MNLSVMNSTVNHTSFTANPTSGFKFPKLIEIATNLTLLASALAVVFNCTVLYIFIRCPRFITPFTVHVVSLTVINLITAAVYEPLLYLYATNHPALRGNIDLCTTLRYIGFITTSLCIMQHLVICLDRWLAVLKPHWYRTKTTKAAFLATISVVVYVNVCYLPILIEYRKKPLPMGQSCDYIIVLPLYQQVARLTAILIPQLILLLASPALLIKLAAIYRKKNHEPTSSSVTESFRIRSRTRSNQVGPILPARNRGQKRERILAVWLMMLQVVFWSPATVSSLLANLRIQYPYVMDVSNLAYMLPCVLLVLDPLVNLLFLSKLKSLEFTRLAVLLRLFRVPCRKFRHDASVNRHF